MDISINTKTNIQKTGFEQATSVHEQQNSSPTSANLSISNAPAPLADDTLGVNIAESAIARDDKLGNLVNAAFNLPAPPMPDFAKIAQAHYHS